MGAGKWVVPACVLFFCLCAAGAWRDDQQGASYLFIAFAAGSLALVGYGRYKKRATADSGPFDPSSDWPSSDDISAGELGTFRYSQGTLLFVRTAAWLSISLAPIIYVASSPKPEGVSLAGLFLFGAVVFTGFYLAYLACRAYSIDVQADAIVVNRLGRCSAYKFSSLGMVALLDGGGGRGARYVLAVYDKADRVLWKIDSGFDGFQKYVVLMKKRCFEEGVAYRYRDMWGNWTK